MRFSVTATNVATGEVADTFKTMLAVIAGDTAGYRGALRKLTIGPSDDEPKDLNVAVKLCRIDDLSAGNAGTKTAVTPVQKDSLSRAAVLSGGKNYTGEPDTYGNPIWEVDMNRRATIVMEWDEEQAPVINRDQLLGLLAAPRTAAAANLTITMEFDER